MAFLVASVRIREWAARRGLQALLQVLALTAASLFTLSIDPRDANAYVVKRTVKGHLVHWDEPSVSFTFDPSVRANVADAVEATTASMRSWSGTVGAPELRGHVAAEVADPPQVPAFDQKNGVFFMPGGYAPAGRALAITVLTYDNNSGRILDADIIVNGAYAFAVLSNGGAVEAQDTPSSAIAITDGVTHDEPSKSSSAVYDLHHVVAHELGHSLGMNDELDRKDALMYRYSSPNDTTLRAPASDDIAGLAELYSTKLEAVGGGCGNATLAPRKPSSAVSQLASVTIFGFLFFLIFRGRTSRHARFAFVAVASLASYAMFPRISKQQGNVARATTLAPGHARASVTSTFSAFEGGFVKTHFTLATVACRAALCPNVGEGVAWGGTVGSVRQDVGEEFSPKTGDTVNVSFARLPSALAPLTQRLGMADSALTYAKVRVITLAE